jgi:ABC-type Zn uptake system ZnuABC Zn-binding protein ZnuA
VVVTTSILGAVVSDVVGEAADVTVLVPNGTDPHDWEPSAKDVEAIGQADLVVSNGLDLEEKLVQRAVTTTTRLRSPVARNTTTSTLKVIRTSGPILWRWPRSSMPWVSSSRRSGSTWAIASSES